MSNNEITEVADCLNILKPFNIPSLDVSDVLMEIGTGFFTDDVIRSELPGDAEEQYIDLDYQQNVYASFGEEVPNFSNNMEETQQFSYYEDPKMYPEGPKIDVISLDPQFFNEIKCEDRYEMTPPQGYVQNDVVNTQYQIIGNNYGNNEQYPMEVDELKPQIIIDYGHANTNFGYDVYSPKAPFGNNEEDVVEAKVLIKRNYAEKRKRTCQKREIKLSDDVRRKENADNSRAYTKRNRDELMECKNEMNKRVDSQMRERRKEQLMSIAGIDVMSEHGLNVQRMITIANRHCNAFDSTHFMNWSQVVEESRMKVNSIVQKKLNLVYEDQTSYDKIKADIEDLVNNKEAHIRATSKSNYASAKSRKNSSFKRADLKRECALYDAEVAAREKQIKQVKAEWDHLSATIWNRFLVVMNNALGHSRSIMNNATDLETWRNIYDHYYQFQQNPLFEQ